MPTLNFAAQFADAVASGEKTQTIRLKRKRPIVAGDRLVLYTGQRTTSCRKLFETKCCSVSEIVITASGVKRDGVALNYASVYFLAMADGFETVHKFREWFKNRYGLPFRGQLIKWKFKEEAH